MINFLQHLLSIFSGIAAVAVNIAILAVLGSAITLVSGKRQSNSLSNVTVPAACLVALCCWYGVKLNIPLPILLGGIAWLAVMIFTHRLLRDGPAIAIADSQLANVFNLRSTVFALFYAIAYLFVTPPVSTDRLPITIIGNHDILNYINVGDYLQHLGPSNIAGLELGRNVSYEAIPAVFPALQATAAFLGGDIMQAALPTMLGVVALIGVAIASIAQAAFALPRSAAIALAAVVISGPLFRLTSGHFFLSQLIASLVLLLLLARTVEFLGDKRSKGWTGVAVSFAPHYILICYLYPVFLVIATGLQTLLVAGTYTLPAALRGEQAIVNREMNATIAQWGAGISSCIVVVVAVDPMHFQQMASWAFELTKMEAGWRLSFISPAAIIGVPGKLQITMRTAQVASSIAFLVVSAVIGYFYLIRGMGRGPVAGRVMFLIAVLVFAIYAGYYYLRGASYQQWKLATYLPLLMSFAWWAPCLSIMHATMKSKTLVASATPLLCALLVVGNLLSYALREPAMRTFSASYANLRSLDMMGTWTDLYVSMSSFATTFFPVYFIRHKTLHLLSDSYYPKEQLELASVSPTRPLFVEGEECKPEAPWTTTVVGVGCLYRQPPTIEFDFNYQLSKQLPISIEAEGLSVQEAWGRWSDGDKVAFRLFASSADLSKAPSGFVNFRIHPYAGRRGTQRVIITWGQSRAEEVIDQPRTISLPYVRDDWKGADLQAITITMDLPDAVSPNAIDPTSGDMRKLAIAFTAMDVTSTPVGSVIGGDRHLAIHPSR